MFTRVLCVALLCIWPLSVRAQGVVAAQGVAELSSAARGALICRNMQIGLEALRLNGLLVEPLVVSRLAVSVPQISLPHVKALENSSQPLDVAIAQAALPGYTLNFSQEFYRVLADDPQKIKQLINRLETAFLPGHTYEGHFLPTFDEVVALTHVPVEVGTSLEQALSRAIRHSTYIKNGFFTIVVSGNDRRAREVFVLDLKRNRWIGVNHSQGQALAMYRAQLTEEVNRGDQAQLLSAQGVLIQKSTDGEEIRVSSDGVLWMAFPARSAVAKDILWAVEHGAYVRFDAKTKKALFSLPGKTEEFDNLADMYEASLFWVWREYSGKKLLPLARNGKLVTVVEKDALPNVYIREKGKVLPLAGHPLVLGGRASIQDAVLFSELEEFSARMGRTQLGRRILFARPVRNGNQPYGKIENYIYYISNDGSFFSADLQEILAYEKEINELTE